MSFSTSEITFGNNLYWIYTPNFFQDYTYQICVSSDLVKWKSIRTPIGYLGASFGGEGKFYIWGNSNSVYSTSDGTTWNSAFQFATEQITAGFIRDTGIISTFTNQVFFSNNLKEWTQQSTFSNTVFEIVGAYGEFWAGMENEDDEEVDVFLQVSLFSLLLKVEQ